MPDKALGFRASTFVRPRRQSNTKALHNIADHGLRSPNGKTIHRLLGTACDWELQLHLKRTGHENHKIQEGLHCPKPTWNLKRSPAKRTVNYKRAFSGSMLVWPSVVIVPQAAAPRPKTTETVQKPFQKQSWLFHLGDLIRRFKNVFRNGSYEPLLRRLTYTLVAL